MKSCFVLFLLSGAAGLGYQTIWTRLFTNALGHEVPAMLAVVAAFFGGLTLGGWLGDFLTSRLKLAGALYLWLELIIGCWALVTMSMVPVVDALGAGLIGDEPSLVRHWLTAFVVPLIVLLPATCAMGATWPSMIRFATQMLGDKSIVGTLYAANTVGALAGVGFSTFMILPRLGFRSSLMVFAFVNFVCAAGAWWLVRRSNNEADRIGKLASSGIGKNLAAASGRLTGLRHDRGIGFERGDLPGEQARKGIGGRSSMALLLMSGFTGFLGIGWEIVSIRVLASVLENTVYTFASALMVYLLGTATGAAFYQNRCLKVEPLKLEKILFLGLALTCVLGMIPLMFARGIYDFVRSILGLSVASGIAAEVFVEALVLAGPACLMGALFAHLVQQAANKGTWVGSATAANTFGCALAPFAFGVLLIPLVGFKWSLLGLVTGYLLLACIHLRANWRALILLPSLIGLLLPRHLQAPSLPPGGALMSYHEGRMDSVAVIRYADGNRSLVVNNRFAMGGTGAALAERRHAHIPLSLHPAPKRALFLGLGTGITFAASAAHPGLRADGVELLPEVVEAGGLFSPENSTGNAGERLKIHVADARRFVRATTNRYDVVVADLFHPSRDGAGLLYTLEHFTAIRSVLEAEGTFCQWLPLYQLDEDVLKTIIRTFLEVFPNTSAWLLRYNIDTPVLGLMGTKEPRTYPPDYLEQRVIDEALLTALKSVQLRNTLELFGGFLGNTDAIRRFAGGGSLNSDDHPIVLFRAPSWSYGPRRPAHERLSLVIRNFTPSPASLVNGTDHRKISFVSELGDFMSARDVYIQGLVHESNGLELAAVKAFVESARRSTNFTLGYAHALTWARQNWEVNRVQAKSVLEELDQTQPGRGVARRMLEQLEKQ